MTAKVCAAMANAVLFTLVSLLFASGGGVFAIMTIPMIMYFKGWVTGLYLPGMAICSAYPFLPAARRRAFLEGRSGWAGSLINLWFCTG